MNGFTVEESNLICIYASKNRKKVMGDITRALPYIDDVDMIELSLQVVDKLKALTDEEFAAMNFEMAE